MTNLILVLGSVGVASVVLAANAGALALLAWVLTGK